MALKITKDINLFIHFGSKIYLKNKIISLLDYSCKTYIEPFVGTGSIALNKPPHKCEIINDFDNDIITLFEVLQTEPDEFMKRLKLLPYSEAVFLSLKERYNTKNFIDKIDRAVCFYYLKNCSINGKNEVFRYSFSRPDAKYHFNKQIKLEKVIERIKNFTILCRDYKDLLSNIPKEKQKDINIYCDPPYYHKEKFYKNSDFTKEDHYKLADLLNSLESKIIITYYPFDEIEELYPKSKWIHIQNNSMKRTAYNSKVRGSQTELILCNYQTEYIEKIF